MNVIELENNIDGEGDINDKDSEENAFQYKFKDK